MEGYGDSGRIIAGGTDLVANLKLGTIRADALVSLSAIDGLTGISTGEHGDLLIGATTTLTTVAESDLVRRHAPALAHAVGRIASPQIRNMATLGGNLCLDTRCRYINQSDLFRTALGGCLKSHGSECHVVPGGKNCVAALSCDSAPVLIALGAELFLEGGSDGPRTMPLASFYSSDGLKHTRNEAGEIITAIRVPEQPEHAHVVYRKWAQRRSIDFPLVSVALRLETDDAKEHLVGGMVVVGTLGPKPRILSLDKLSGDALNDDLATTLGALAAGRCKPLPNIPYDAEYRRRRLGVETKRATLALLEGLKA